MMREDGMTARRFRDIVEAYGAESARWPQDERDAATVFAAAHPDLVAPWIEEARQSDALLNLAGMPQVTDRMQYQAVARMIAANDVTGSMPSPRRRLPLLWAGMGLAACLAGAVLGVEVSMRSLDDMRAQLMLEQAQMVDIIDDRENG